MTARITLMVAVTYDESQLAPVTTDLSADPPRVCFGLVPPGAADETVVLALLRSRVVEGR